MMGVISHLNCMDFDVVMKLSHHINKSGSASVVRNSANFVYPKFNSVSANNTLGSDLDSMLASQCCNIFEHRSLLVL